MWQSQRQKNRHWFAPHCSNIAETACKTAMANRFRRMPIASKVNAFQSEVGGYQTIASGGWAEDRAVISDSGENGAGAASSPTDRAVCYPADFDNEPFLRQWHDKTLYRMLPAPQSGQGSRLVWCNKNASCSALFPAAASPGARTVLVYPYVGKTSDDGHNFVYNSIPVWETDVFRFLDENVRR
jgi:hypothetical protein